MQLLKYSLLGSIAMLAGVVVIPTEQAQAALIAQWTFNKGNISDLTSDIGGFTFAEGGTGGSQITTYNSDGTISLGNGRLLYASAINSSSFASLKTSVTIWVRFKIDSTSTGNAPVFGLINSTGSLTGNFVDFGGTQIREKYCKTAAAWLSVGDANKNVAFTGFITAGNSIGAGSNTNQIKTGEYISAAITVSDPGSLTYADRTNGNTVSRGAGNVDIINFQSFAIGRLWSDAGNPVTIDEIRIYDTVLSDAEIDALSAVPIPEVTTLGMLSLAGALLLRRKR